MFRLLIIELMGGRDLMYSLEFGKSYFCWGTAASCSLPELRYRTLYTPLKPQSSVSTRLFLSSYRSFCPGVPPVGLPYLVSTVAGSSCPFLLLTGTVWHGDSCLSLPLPCGSCFPSPGICLVSVLTPCPAALPATVQVADWCCRRNCHGSITALSHEASSCPWGPGSAGCTCQ